MDINKYVEGNMDGTMKLYLDNSTSVIILIFCYDTKFWRVKDLINHEF